LNQAEAMAQPSWIDKLKRKWKLESAAQVVWVLIVFACTGLSALFLKKPIMQFLAGADGETVSASVIYYVFIMTPMYNVLLLAYAFVFGQFNFFWEFEKRLFRRIFGSKTKR
jgi:hypothetical protein